MDLDIYLQFKVALRLQKPVKPASLAYTTFSVMMKNYYAQGAHICVVWVACQPAPGHVLQGLELLGNEKKLRWKRDKLTYVQCKDFTFSLPGETVIIYKVYRLQ